MDFLKRYKYILLTLVIAAGAYAVYTFYFSAPEGDLLSRAGGGESRAASVDKELIALLQSLQSLELDSTLLGTVEFRSLIDFSQMLEPEGVGRANPFEPLEASAARN